MAMREHKEATTQEIPCVVASFFISWHRQVETPGQISRRSYRPLGQSKSQANRLGSSGSALVGEGGFEPPKSLTTDLQSAPFGHSGIPPYSIPVACRKSGAGRRTRTPDLLITNQLLYQLSYTSIATAGMIITERRRNVNRFCNIFLARRSFYSPAAPALCASSRSMG